VIARENMHRRTLMATDDPHTSWRASAVVGAESGDLRIAEAELAAAASSRDPERVADAASRHFWPLLTEWPGDLEAILASLPDATLARHPILAVLHPMAAALGVAEPPAAERTAEDRAKRLQYLAVKMIAARRRGDVASALGAADRLTAALSVPRVPSIAIARGSIPFTFAQISITRLLAGESLAALRAAMAARHLAEHSPTSPVIRLALALTAVAHAVRGSLAEAELALAEGLDLPMGARWFAGSTRAAERVAAELVGVERADPESLQTLRGGDWKAQAGEFWPLAMLARARAAIVRGVAADALEIVCAAVDGAPGQGLAADVSMSQCIEAHLALQDVTGARAIAEQLRAPGLLTAVALAKLRLVGGDPARALAELRRLSAARTLPPAQREEIQLLGVWIRADLGGGLDVADASAIARLVEGTARRRLLAVTLPVHVRDAIEVHLRDDELALFRRSLKPLPALRNESPPPPLSRSELRVLQALVDRASVDEIAQSLFVSRNTVKTQLRTAYRKLGAHTRDEAIAAAIRWSLLDGPRPRR
jgi:DNA-binding CsgD family transcriptional regulator